MTTYKTGGIADAGIAILVGLLVGLFFASLVNSSNDKRPDTQKKQETQQTQAVEQPKPAEAPKVESKPAEQPKQKEDCTFWRTMAFANSGKSMWAYYYTQWQACEGRQ